MGLGCGGLGLSLVLWKQEGEDREGQLAPRAPVERPDEGWMAKTG